MEIANYSSIAKDVIQEIYDHYAQAKDSTNRLVVDNNSHNYLLISNSWQHGRRYYGIIIHIEIKADGKVWVHEDNTELIVVDRLLERGISPKNMVIGWHPPSMREVTEFAVA